MNAHTPGPWRVEYTGMHGYTLHADGYRRDGGEANAKLMAAAPDLLEALINARQLLLEAQECSEEDSTYFAGHVHHRTLDQIAFALTKAGAL